MERRDWLMEVEEDRCSLGRGLAGCLCCVCVG